MNESDAVWRENFEEIKSESVAQLLFKCGRLWNEQAIRRLRVKIGADWLRPSHMTLFPHIDFEGTRLTDLAARLEVTKQAAGQLVNEFEQHGFLERIPDPQDGRARLIVLSEHGRASMMDGMALLAEMEGELKDKIGVRKMKQLHGALTSLLAQLERVGD